MKEKIQLKIQGMTCSNCASGIERQLRNKGFENVNVSFTNQELTCSLKTSQSLKTLSSIIKNLGYKIVKKEENIYSFVEKLFVISLDTSSAFVS